MEDDSRVAPKPAGFAGSGGSWRAFISVLFRKQPELRGNFRQAAALYRQMKAQGGQEWEDVQRMGRMGTEAHRAGGRAFATSHSCKLPEAVDELLSEMLTGKQRSSALVPSRGDWSAQLEAHMQELTALSQKTREASRAAHAEEQAQGAALNHWAEGQAELPQCKGVPFALSPTLAAPATFTAELSVSLVELCKQAVVGANNRLFPAVRRQWDSWHEMIRHEQCMKIPPSLKRTHNDSKVCLRAKMCL